MILEVNQCLGIMIMSHSFTLAPRYRLDDESPWLEGIDPMRAYWLWVNGDQNCPLTIPGVSVTDLEELRPIIQEFRDLQPNAAMQVELTMATEPLSIICISSNCYAIPFPVLGAMAWHLFDQETLESLLMTAHPDWQCAPAHLDLGRRRLQQVWQQPIAA
jgi:hypothetical protein